MSVPHRPPAEIGQTMTVDAAEIDRFLSLVYGPTESFEVRAWELKGHKKLVSAGFFNRRLVAGTDTRPNLADQIETHLQQAEGVYVTPQQRRLSRLRPQIGSDCRPLTRDLDIAWRRFVLIDIDRVKATTPLQSATDAEKAATLALAGRVKAWFAGHGWAAPLEIDSGNGAHLYYRLPVPLPGGSVADALADPLALLLMCLAHRFDEPTATIDTKVFNPSRVMKLPGTLARKGTPTADRPYRPCRVLSVPADWVEPLPLGLKSLGELVASLPPAPDKSSEPSPVAVAVSRPASEPAREWDGELPPREVRLKRAARYLATLPGGKDGSRGSCPTYNAAVAMYHYFALDFDDALHLLQTIHNPKCDGPWNEDDLRHKLDDARKKPHTRDYGGAYKNDKPRPAQQAARPHVEAEPSVPTDLPSNGAAPDRPTVLVDTDEYRVNDEASAALGREPDLYQRGGVLVAVARAGPGDGEASGVRRKLGTWVIHPLHQDTLRERLSRAVRFVRRTDTKEGLEETLVHPPTWCYKAVHRRTGWPAVRHLQAVLPHPVLLDDGRVLGAAGYDPDSGLLLAPSHRLEVRVPETPTAEDVRAAIALLLDLVADFPFASPAHRAAWVAGLLTPLAYFAFDGPAPMFLFDANVRAAGKGLLTDVIGISLTGRRFPVMSYAHDENEFRKRVTSLAVSGDRTVLLDNLTGRIGNGTFDAATTADTWQDRLLGINKNYDGPLHVTWYATGNNCQFRGDLTRRIIRSRLESTHERPELRTDLRRPKLRKHVMVHRGPILSAALTLLRHYHVSGRPTLADKPMGSFEPWSDLVRQAVMLAGLPDPLDTQVGLMDDADEDLTILGNLIAGIRWMDQSGSGVTVASMVKQADREYEPCDGQAALVEAFALICNGKLDNNLIGQKIKSLAGRPCGGRCIKKAGITSGAPRWGVKALDPSQPFSPDIGDGSRGGRGGPGGPDHSRKRIGSASGGEYYLD